MVIHAKKSTFILKMHKPSIIILDSMINKPKLFTEQYLKR